MALEFPDIDPVAFALGPFEVRWYALAYMAGLLLGWQYCMKLAGLDVDKRPQAEDFDDFLAWAILGVILGGRLGYVLFYQPGYFLSEPLAIIQIWKGGMSFHGGALGVIGAMALYCRVRGIHFLRFADLLVCAVPIGLFFGRIANFINGELYGREASVPWAVRFPAGDYVPRHPSQIYEALLEGLVLFAVLAALVRMQAVRDKPGVLGGVFLMGYGIARAIVEFFREPDAHLGLIGGFISMGQILSLPMVLAGLGLCLFAFWRQDRADNQ